MTEPDFRTRIATLRQYAAERAEAGDAAEVRRAGDALLSVDDSELKRAEPDLTRNMLDAVSSMVAVGDSQRAEVLLMKGIQALSANPQATKVDLIIPLHNLMAVYDERGDIPRRNQAAGAIGRIAEQLDEPLTPGAAGVLLELGRLLEQVGNINGTLVMYRPVHAYMIATAAADPDTVLTWTMTYASALMSAGRHDDVIAVCRQALEVSGAAGVTPGRKVEVFGVLAMAATRKQDASAAAEALERGAAVAESLETSETALDPRVAAAAGAVYHNLAGLYVQQQRSDKYERAEALMRRALAIVLQQRSEGTAEHAGALGQLAVIVELRGDLDAAERLYTESVATYEAARDTPRAEFSDFLTDFGLMQLRRGRPADAVAPLLRAVSLREGTPDESPTRRASAASNLATAYFQSGELGPATREFTRALDLRFAAEA